MFLLKFRNGGNILYWIPLKRYALYFLKYIYNTFVTISFMSIYKLLIMFLLIQLFSKMYICLGGPQHLHIMSPVGTA